MNARRVTIYTDPQGLWRYRVQARNWRTIAASEEGFARKATVLKRARQYWPGVEIVIVD